MTLEKATKDMQELVEKHDFQYEGELTYDGRQIFTRRWAKKIEVVWYGESESTLEIKISMITTTDVKYQITDESYYRCFNLKYSSTTVTLTISTGGGSILRVFGIN